MRASEFITEADDKVNGSVAAAMPATFALPGLQNQDAYRQYRFGIALAAARAHSEGHIPVEKSSDFGENMVVVARSKEEEETLALALKLVGEGGQSKMISTAKSEETSDVNTTSPSAPQYSRKLRKG